jgi:hypothetical protein
MGIVSRLRAYLQKKHTATKAGQIAQSEAYASQIASIEQRAEMIRRAFMWTLYSLTGTIVTCLLLGLGLYWPHAEIIAAALFVISMIGLLTGMMHYVREVSLALTSVREEAADSRFMDLNDSASGAENVTAPPM